MTAGGGSDGCGETNWWSYRNSHYLSTSCSIPSGGRFFILLTNTHTLTLESFAAYKDSSMCTISSPPPVTLNGLKVSVHTRCDAHLKHSSFLTYHCPLTPSVQMVPVEWNNLAANWFLFCSGWKEAGKKMYAQIHKHTENKHTHKDRKCTKKRRE